MEKPAIAENLRVHEMNKLKQEETYYEFLEAGDNGAFTGRSKNGCNWTTIGDWVSPSPSWKDCSKDPKWHSGENRNLTKKGEIWPLKVGNSVSYSYKQINAQGIDTGKKTRKCKVTDSVNIDVAAGNLDTYKIVCKRIDGSWSETQTFYFSPETRSPVKYVRTTSSEGITRDTEFLRYQQL